MLPQDSCRQAGNPPQISKHCAQLYCLTCVGSVSTLADFISYSGTDYSCAALTATIPKMARLTTVQIWLLGLLLLNLSAAKLPLNTITL